MTNNRHSYKYFEITYLGTNNSVFTHFLDIQGPMSLTKVTVVEDSNRIYLIQQSPKSRLGYSSNWVPLPKKVNFSVYTYIHTYLNN